MKIRNDFVSNSSSCSFIIAIRKTFLLKTFIKEACKGCLKHADTDDSKDFITQQNEYNNVVLNYHLRASELLYLGSLDVGTMQNVFTKDNDNNIFDELKNDIAKNRLASIDHVVSNTNDQIVIESKMFVDGMAIPKHMMDVITMEYHWNNDYRTDIDKQKKVAKAIVDFAKNYSDENVGYKCQYDSSTYFISRNTIWNTRALIAAGYDVELEKWMDLDKFDKMLQDGDQIFGICVNNGGDGVSEDSLYTFGGWDGEDVFDNISGAQILYSETL